MEKIKALLDKLPHRMQVRFAIYCARDVVEHRSKDDIHSAKCIELVEAWLKDPSSVSTKELQDAASYAAYAASAASAASYAAYAAASAAAYAASAATTTSAAYAASYAAYAASAASAAAKLKQYELKLKDMTKNLSKLEKELYNIKEAI